MMRPITPFLRLIPALLAVEAAVQAANFSIDPWIMVMEPQSNKVSEVITVRHTGGNPASTAPTPALDVAPVPVELNIQAREVDLDGNVKVFSTPDSADFVIFPSQLILYPGDVQKVQVQWAGSKPPKTEIAYSLVASQLPMELDLGKEKPQSAKGVVNILTRYHGVIIVRPARTKARVNVDTAYAQADSAGNKLVLILKNDGNGRQKLDGMTVRLIPKDAAGKLQLNKAHSFQSQANAQATKQSLFAGFKRRLEIPWPAQVPVGPVQASVTFANPE